MNRLLLIVQTAYRSLFQFICYYWSYKKHAGPSDLLPKNVTRKLTRPSEASYSKASEHYEQETTNPSGHVYEASQQLQKNGSEDFQRVSSESRGNKFESSQDVIQNASRGKSDRTPKKRTPKQIEAYKKNFAKRWEKRGERRLLGSRQSVYDEIF